MPLEGDEIWEADENGSVVCLDGTRWRVNSHGKLSQMPNKTVDEMVDQAERDAEDMTGDDAVDVLTDAIADVGLSAAVLFDASLGDNASASANVMTEDGMVRVTVSITEVD